jgi:hypothetical protein
MVKKQNYTRKVGRPTKYSLDKVEFVEDYIVRMQKENKLPVVQEVAYLLDVDDTTLVTWGKKHKKFLASIKKLMAAQATMLQQGIYDDSKQHGAGGIFLLKNNHHFTDQQNLDVTSGGKPLPTPIMSINPNVIHPNDSDS